GAGPRGRARPRIRAARAAVRPRVARLAGPRLAVAPLQRALRLLRRARDAAGGLGAQRGVLGLRDGDRAGLAQHDLRAVLRGGSDLLGPRDGADDPDPDAATVRAR